MHLQSWSVIFTRSLRQFSSVLLCDSYEAISSLIHWICIVWANLVKRLFGKLYSDSCEEASPVYSTVCRYLIVKLNLQLGGGSCHLPLVEPSMRASPLTPSEWREKLEARKRLETEAAGDTSERKLLLLDARNGKLCSLLSCTLTNLLLMFGGLIWFEVVISTYYIFMSFIFWVRLWMGKLANGIGHQNH